MAKALCVRDGPASRDLRVGGHGRHRGAPRCRENCRTVTLVAIGSGGSLTAAHALAAIHRRATHQVTAVATPLDAATEPLDPSATIWLLSAGGGNVDILSALEALVSREPRQIAVLCGKDDSPLASLCRQHPFVDLMIFPPPAGKDGFLATNSLLGFTSLIARAYAAEFGAELDWEGTAGCWSPCSPQVRKRSLHGRRQRRRFGDGLRRSCCMDQTRASGLSISS